MISAPLDESIIGRAISKKLVCINTHDLRDWTEDRHRTIDDTPYGGGAGMVYKIEPLYKCITEIIEKTESENRELVLTSPRGEVFEQKKAIEFSFVDHLIIICGHYKGVDQRIKSFFPIREVSVGDYILSGGEIPAILMIDATVRLLPGVLNDIDSAMTDSFSDNLLDCDYFTRPENFKGVSVPEVLLSGDHKKIENWRLEQRENLTRDKRPDLYKKYEKNIKIK